MHPYAASLQALPVGKADVARSNVTRTSPPPLRLVKASPEVIHRRPGKRKPLPERIAEAAPALATLEDAADWAELSTLLFDNPSRLGAKARHADGKSGGKVIELPLPGRRSTSREIQQVRAEEVCRGVPRKVL